MREGQGTNTRCCSLYVFDDGWNPPYEVIEEIELRVAQSESSKLKEAMKLRAKHKSDWLTAEVAEEYYAKSWIYREAYGNKYIGKVKEIGDELRRKYGVTEIEAINILAGRNVSDYVNKYHRLKNLIPNSVDYQKICDEVVGEFFMAM